MSRHGEIMIRIGICGISGRMGKVFADELTSGHWPDLVFSIGGARGRDDFPFPVTSDPAALFSAADVVIDFTVPEATRRHAALAAQTGTPLIVGTTGLSPDDEIHLKKASETAPILVSANMSLGVNLLLSLVQQAARVLGPDFDIEISETHHRHKVDAPSGTALSLGHAAASGRGQYLADLTIPTRSGHTGPRPAGGIGFGVLRGGNVAGDHGVNFLGDAEHVTLSHHAVNRSIFARGALRAAQWIYGREAGYYGMVDVLADHLR
jgi:4-hydroxy-tetrahydrodipicolinate reductase